MVESVLAEFEYEDEKYLVYLDFYGKTQIVRYEEATGLIRQLPKAPTGEHEGS